MVELNVHFEIAGNTIERDHKLPREHLFSNGCARESTGEGWVFIDNVASWSNIGTLGDFVAECATCEHFREIDEKAGRVRRCVLDFDILNDCIHREITCTTIHEILHLFGCDEKQVTALEDMLGLKRMGCPMCNPVSESEFEKRCSKRGEPCELGGSTDG